MGGVFSLDFVVIDDQDRGVAASPQSRDKDLGRQAPPCISGAWKLAGEPMAVPPVTDLTPDSKHRDVACVRRLSFRSPYGKVASCSVVDAILQTT